MNRPSRGAAVQPLVAFALAIAVLFVGGGAGEGEAGRAALAHPWHDAGAGHPTCPPWDDPLCERYAGNATVAYDSHYLAGHDPILPHDGIVSPEYGLHGWWWAPHAGIDAAFLCGMDGPYLTEPANGTGFFGGPYPMPLDMARDHPHGPPGAYYEDVRAACLLDHPAGPMAGVQQWRGGLSSPTAGFVPGAGSGRFHGIDGYGRMDYLPMTQLSLPASAPGAGGAHLPASKIEVQNAGRPLAGRRRPRC